MTMPAKTSTNVKPFSSFSGIGIQLHSYVHLFNTGFLYSVCVFLDEHDGTKNLV
ncbi:hypothetical protein GCM10008986_26810 [Salinibacillus aidingensis]|uniref:Uncharacterized protein n=1 Tax=Salinibacillus aidingensis TaxID=237684 RepID=A0ABN1BI32_9BACI